MKNVIMISIALGALAWAGSAEEPAKEPLSSFLFVSN